jgi:hypothetical protein
MRSAISECRYTGEYQKEMAWVEKRL